MSMTMTREEVAASCIFDRASCVIFMFILASEKSQVKPGNCILEWSAWMSSGGGSRSARLANPRRGGNGNVHPADNQATQDR